MRQCVELRRDSSRRKHQQQGSKWRDSKCENLDQGCKTFNEKQREGACQIRDDVSDHAWHGNLKKDGDFCPSGHVPNQYSRLARPGSTGQMAGEEGVEAEVLFESRYGNC